MLVMMGSTMEPTISTAPRPLIPVNTNAVAASIRNAMAIGRSPANSAAFLMMASEIPVFCMTLANMAPNTTSAMAEDSLSAPPSRTSLAQARKGSPAHQAIHAAMSGSASKAGRILVTMSAANRTKPPSNNIPVTDICYSPHTFSLTRILK